MKEGSSSKMKASQTPASKKEIKKPSGKQTPVDPKHDKSSKTKSDNKEKKNDDTKSKPNEQNSATEKQLSENEEAAKKNKETKNEKIKETEHGKTSDAPSLSKVNSKGNSGSQKGEEIEKNKKTGSIEKHGNSESTAGNGNSSKHEQGGNHGKSENTANIGSSSKHETNGTSTHHGNSGYSSKYGNNYGSGYDSGYGYYENKKKVPGIFGFYNNKIYNNCFMNSSLQNLLHCEEFTKLLHSIPDYNLSDKPLAKEVKSLIGQMNRGEDELDASRIKGILSNVEEKYKHNEQQDANEFITIFLNQLLKELKGSSGYSTKNIPNDEKERKAFNKLEERFFLQNKSFLLDLFYGRLRRDYICQNGHLCLVKFNNYNTLILPQPIKSNNIYDLLKLYQEGKSIDDKIFCNTCKKELRYSIETKIYSIPKYFIVCLEKGSSYYDNGIDFHPVLKTKNFMDNPQGEYNLNSLIEYSGNRKSGHYTAKVCQNNEWFSISDSSYGSISESEIYNSAIILFYSRID